MCHTVISAMKKQNGIKGYSTMGEKSLGNNFEKVIKECLSGETTFEQRPESVREWILDISRKVFQIRK